MASFHCDHCGTRIMDSPNGYITECKHWPIYSSRPSAHDPPGTPTPEEIRERAKEIQKEWGPFTERKRAGRIDGPVELLRLIVRRDGASIILEPESSE